MLIRIEWLRSSRARQTSWQVDRHTVNGQTALSAHKHTRTQLVMKSYMAKVLKHLFNLLNFVSQFD